MNALNREIKQLQDKYLTETIPEAVDEIESLLILIQKSKDNENRIGEVQRLVHTIKGSSSSFGFESIATICHSLENHF